MRSRTFKILFFALFLLGAGHLYYDYSGNFRTDYVLPSGSYDLPLFLPVMDSEKSKEVQFKLDQKFHYIGHGHQTYVFMGEDGETMLKLFMKQYIRSDWLRYLFPPIPPFRERMLHQGSHHDFRLNRLLSGYTLTYTLDPENCGLIYFHVDQELPIEHVTLVDAFGFNHQISINQTVFALQKKATVTKTVLHQLLDAGDFEDFEEKIDQLLLLYREQFDKGLVDRDRNFLENTGFIDGRAVRIDVGKVVLNEGAYTLSEEYDKIIKGRLSRWLKKYHPEYGLLNF